MRTFGLLLAVGSLASAAPAQAPPSGTIKGRVVDAGTLTSLAGVEVTVSDGGRTVRTNGEGAFSFSNVPVGSYLLSFRHAGYIDLVKPDIVVRSTRISFVEAELPQMARLQEEVTVATYFRDPGVAELGSFELSAEELRRAPGAAGDVSRALYVLPGVVQVEDAANDLVVRGGSPFENGFYVDDIPFPNINHYPQQGASGGGIGMLNADFIQDVEISTGGFGAAYGGRLSSIIDIQYREANRHELDGQLDLSTMGFGGALEGPLAAGRGSWFLSARRSYLDLLDGILELGERLRWGDAQAKVVCDLSRSQRLSLFGIFGDSHQAEAESAGFRLAPGSDLAEVDLQPPAGLEPVGDESHNQLVAGLGWRALWGGRGYSQTSVSFARLSSGESYQEPVSRHVRHRSDYVDRSVSVRSRHHFQIRGRDALDLGVEGRQGWIESLNLDTEEVGRTYGSEVAAFASYAWRPSSWLRAELGGRLERFSHSDRLHLAPRVAFSVMPTVRLSLSGAFGIYHQALPFALLLQDEGNQDLADLESTHYCAGVSYRIAPDTRLSVEAYSKEYRHFPLSAREPMVFVIDEVHGGESTFSHWGALRDAGHALSRGVELALQKKLSRRFYGLISASLSRSRYRDLGGQWRNRLHDNRYVLNLIGGFRPNRSWEFSARWAIAGGKAETPIDVEASGAAGDTVRDASRFMEGHLPAYHQLKLRVDRRFDFHRSSLTTFLSLWNVYNRKNVRSRYWDSYEDRVMTDDQLPLFPVFGIEYEF